MNYPKRHFLILNIILILYSLSTVCGKMAAMQEFGSTEFFLLYFGMILLLVIYAIGWQQVIKSMPLSIAFTNKAITVVWGIIWGNNLFNEKISILKLIGAMVVIVGVVLYVLPERQEDTHDR